MATEVTEVTTNPPTSRVRLLIVVTIMIPASFLIGELLISLWTEIPPVGQAEWCLCSLITLIGIAGLMFSWLCAIYAARSWR